mmetsp:Transcript_26458/g.74024  ORF Transcript_26458/g.74024 Transcript_26458/m.74024 type:complete len:209 (-) Transcript_26458:5177-5803(-)
MRSSQTSSLGRHPRHPCRRQHLPRRFLFCRHSICSSVPVEGARTRPSRRTADTDAQLRPLRASGGVIDSAGILDAPSVARKQAADTGHHCRCSIRSCPCPWTTFASVTSPQCPWRADAQHVASERRWGRTRRSILASVRKRQAPILLGMRTALFAFRPPSRRWRTRFGTCPRLHRNSHCRHFHRADLWHTMPQSGRHCTIAVRQPRRE